MRLAWCRTAAPRWCWPWVARRGKVRPGRCGKAPQGQQRQSVALHGEGWRGWAGPPWSVWCAVTTRWGGWAGKVKHGKARHGGQAGKGAVRHGTAGVGRVCRVWYGLRVQPRSAGARLLWHGQAGKAARGKVATRHGQARPSRSVRNGRPGLGNGSVRYGSHAQVWPARCGLERRYGREAMRGLLGHGQAARVRPAPGRVGVESHAEPRRGQAGVTWCNAAVDRRGAPG